MNSCIEALLVSLFIICFIILLLCWSAELYSVCIVHANIIRMFDTMLHTKLWDEHKEIRTKLMQNLHEIISNCLTADARSKMHVASNPRGVVLPWNSTFKSTAAIFSK